MFKGNPENTEITAYNDSIDINALPILTRPQLATYNGIDNPQLYVAINGYVYDVTGNSNSYGPGKSYHKLVGKDVARLLGINKLTSPDNMDTWDTTGLTEKQLESIDKWIIFFRKRYRVVGVIGGHES